MHIELSFTNFLLQLTFYFIQEKFTIDVPISISDNTDCSLPGEWSVWKQDGV